MDCRLAKRNRDLNVRPRYIEYGNRHPLPNQTRYCFRRAGTTPHCVDRRYPTRRISPFACARSGFSTGDEKSPATVLAVTNHGWLVASETEEGGAALEKSAFSDTLFLELTSILLFGQLRIYFAAVDTSNSVMIKFETVGEEFYREAIDLVLAGTDPALTAVAEKDRNEASMFEAWPMKFRSEAQRYWPSGQRLLSAIQWPAVLFQQLAPAGALLITEREFVLISEGRNLWQKPLLHRNRRIGHLNKKPRLHPSYIRK